MSRLSAGVVNILVTYRLVWAGIWGVAVLLAWAIAPQLTMDRSVDRLLDQRDEEIRSYQTLGRVFGAYEPIVVAYDDPEVLLEGTAGIDRIRQLEAHLDHLPGVAETISLADLDDLVQETLGHSISRPAFFSNQMLEVLEGFTHSQDRQTVAVLCLVEKSADRGRIIQSIRQWLLEHTLQYPHAALVGEPVMVEEGIRMLERDGARLNLNASVLMALVLLISFRSLRWMLIAGVVVQGSLAITRLILVVSGAQLTLVSTMFSSVVTVIAVAAVMHWIVRFREAQVDTGERTAAMRQSLQQLIKPMTWACLTDAAGFAALLVASVGPVRDFGWIMILGSLSVLLALLAAVPCLTLLPLPRWLAWLDADPHPAWQERMVDRQLEMPLQLTRFAPQGWILAIGLLSLVASAGLWMTRVETDFTRNFKPASSIVRDYRYFEDHLGGAGVWDILVGFDRPLDWEAVKSIRQLEERLLTVVKVESDRGTQPGITQTLSVPDAIVAVLPFDLSTLPLVGDFVVRQGMQQLQARMPSWLETMYGRDPADESRWYVRVLLRSNQQQSAEESQAVIEQVKRICAETFPDRAAEDQPKVTGWFVLLTRLVTYLMADQLKTFLVAASAIFLMMWLATGKFRLALVALVPNLLPIGVVLGTLGWLGIPINMGVALIAAVSIGLSIDNTLHYLAIFQRELAMHRTLAEAIQSAQHRAGMASVFSTVALTAGFATLCLSEFVPTIYFGGLVCASMLGGLLGNLLLLPLLLRVVLGKQTPPTAGCQVSTVD